MARSLSALITSLAILAASLSGAPVRAVDHVTYYVGHADEILNYADGSNCAATTYWTDGEVAYDSDDDIVQDVVDLASAGDTIHLCAGTWEFASHVDTQMVQLSIVGDGIDETIVDGGALYDGDGERVADGSMLFHSGAIDLLADMTIQNGGAVAEGDSAVIASSVNVERVHFYRNESEELGGALTVGAGTITSSSFVGNRAGVYGGGVYAASLVLEDSTFEDNYAEYAGGAVVAFGPLVSRNSDFIGNYVSNEGGDFSETGGGAIAGGGSVSITGGSFTGNAAAFGGGALYAASGEAVSISGVDFENNITLGLGGAVLTHGPTEVSRSRFHANSGAMGGAIFSIEEWISIDRSNFTSNTASSEFDPIFGGCAGGGGAVIALGDVETMRSTYSGNRALIPDEFDFDACLGYPGLLIGSGGAISALGYVWSSSDRFNGNSADTWGGAVVSFAGISDPDASLGYSRIIGSSFVSNSAGSSAIAALDIGLGSVGGALTQLGGSLSVESSRFMRNQTGNAGGAIVYQAISPDDYLRLTRNTISENRVGIPEFTTPSLPTYGGGLFLIYTYDDPTKFEISRNTISGNSGADYGGGAYIVSQVFDGVQRNTIRGNRAGRGGGLSLATCEAPSRRVEATLRATNTISRNRASVDRDISFDLESIYCLAFD